MSLSRFQLQFHLEKQANIIRQSPAFHAAIVKHGELLRETYKKHPLFYKIIFRNSRFIICSTILSIYYHQHAAALKDIKAFFKGKNMISENSLDSFLFFLRVGRRLEVKPCEHDKRQLRYKPTPHALAETQALIASMARPYQALAPQMPIAAPAGGARLSVHLFRRLRATDAQGGLPDRPGAAIRAVYQQRCRPHGAVDVVYRKHPTGLPLSAALLGENRQVLLRLTRAREPHSAGGGKIRPADHHQ
ncbi:hypothetical protein OKB57_12635 [Serratia marcescens]|uniref:hypothetical protein n=1 Tax=Serratia marcescens TaxID=615 RepID=UPI0022243DD1|nr:hypothetical protein [Serratia marcescens]UYY65438.1 hypothetical protein OKB57_12635 [Serratia marcescens]